MQSWKLRRMKGVNGEVSGRGAAGLETGALDVIKKRLERLQLGLPERPCGPSGDPLDPKLPSDLTSLNDIKLGKLYGQFCQMSQYAQLHLAIYSVQKSVYRQAEKYLRARSHLQQEGTVADKSASVECDKRVREMTMKSLVEQGTEDLTQAMLASFLIGRDACSRELTRRQITLERRNER